MFNQMILLEKFNFFSNNSTVEKILSTNGLSSIYGLILTHTDAVALVEKRNQSLSANGRIEVENTTISKIIDAFCDSVYITQKDYANTLHELLDIFYYMKNETLDLLPDDKLIDLMKFYFESKCQGSLELLRGREMETVARFFRYSTSKKIDVSFSKEDL